VAPEFGEQALHSPSRENAPGRQQNNQKTSRLWRKFHCRNKVIRGLRADRPGSAAAGREAAFPDLVLLESALKRGYPGLFPSTLRLFRAIRGLHRVTSNSSGRFLILSGSSLTGNARFQVLPRRLRAPNCQDAALSRRHEAIARTLMPDPPKSSFHRAQSMPVRGAPKSAPGDSQHRIAFWNLIRVTGSVIRRERKDGIYGKCRKNAPYQRRARKKDNPDRYQNTHQVSPQPMIDYKPLFQATLVGHDHFVIKPLGFSTGMHHVFLVTEHNRANTGQAGSNLNNPCL
jgi:hypothetical protein